MSASSIYLKHEITIKDLGLKFGADPRVSLTNKWLFVGIDMAPIESLETGITVIDRDRRIVRMDKMNDDDQLLLFLENLAPPENLIVALDVPKSLSIPSKWRQQQIKMHPLRIEDELENMTRELVPTDRYAQRAKDFYDAVTAKNILIFSFFTAHAKLRYELNIPYRHRSPQGCRAMQALMKQRLGIQDIPANLAPSSVLDAMIGAYTAWIVCKGKEGEHFKVFQDDENRLYLDPLKRTRLPKKR